MKQNLDGQLIINDPLRNDSGYSDKEALKLVRDGLKSNKIIKIRLPGSKYVLGVFKSQVLGACKELKKEKKENPEKYKRIVSGIKSLGMEHVLKENSHPIDCFIKNGSKEEHDNIMWDTVAYRAIEYLEEGKALFRNEKVEKKWVS
jgi:hypothetical protein